MLENRFRREAQTTSQLRSPHTVELYDFGVTEDGDFYYVMEFLNGLDLDSLVTEFGPLDPARAVFLLSQACMSLSEAHLAGLVHRDVKPANLFACRLGPHYDFVKLLDFGIVRSTTNPNQTFTSPGQLKGTPTSFPPEVAEGEQASFASDIYGLGCVAYWLLAGQHVFEAPTLMGLIVKHASKPPKPLSEHRTDLPKELDDLVLRCLAKDPADRPASASELAECLEAIPFDNPWDNRCAQAWWETNAPAATQASGREEIDETVFINPNDTK
jgi:serine/threonine-protein kinase